MAASTFPDLSRATAHPRSLDAAALASLLALEDSSDAEKQLFAAARSVKDRTIGRKISIRALIEAGNICAKDCFYCGIRRSNGAARRYTLGADEIALLAARAKAAGFASIVIQSGEIESPAHTAFIADVLDKIQPLDMGVTLSLGEQSPETYALWRSKGASRYLLRIESSNPALYARLHPADHSWQRRRDCLRALSRLGYQVGTGVMCGLPGQTPLDLARDIEFFAEIDADMIGMGPWIPHPDAPLQPPTPWDDAARKKALHLGLRMIAATRLYLHDVNIAATTALEALAPDGRELGILAGANVLMPNVTGEEYSRSYSLYEGKPIAAAEPAADALAALERRLAALGEKILLHKRGDSPHYAAKHPSTTIKTP